jgi:archaellum biogenesis protein FlaJ (TadC family)
MMKKEFGKWLMDIAKYIVTAIILSSFFSGMNEQRWIYVVAIVIAAIIVTWGLYLQKDEQKNKRRR